MTKQDVAKLNARIKAAERRKLARKYDKEKMAVEVPGFVKEIFDSTPAEKSIERTRIEERHDIDCTLEKQRRAKEQARKKKKKAHLSRGKKGQPLMAGMIDDIVSKLKGT